MKETFLGGSMMIISGITGCASAVRLKTPAESDSSSFSKRLKPLGRILELVLYQHDVVENIRAFGRLVLANLGYMRRLLWPLVLSLLPLVLIMAQLSAWYEQRALPAG
ncbi:MAG TPA: hypothetical protein PKM75_09635, partial [Prolixibacteraceae bacterium]|nr:hypothetical protein [Prolixibacteraceae bacterium]